MSLPNTNRQLAASTNVDGVIETLPEPLAMNLAPSQSPQGLDQASSDVDITLTPQAMPQSLPMLALPVEATALRAVTHGGRYFDTDSWRALRDIIVADLLAPRNPRSENDKHAPTEWGIKPEASLRLFQAMGLQPGDQFLIAHNIKSASTIRATVQPPKCAGGFDITLRYANKKDGYVSSGAEQDLDCLRTRAEIGVVESRDERDPKKAKALYHGHIYFLPSMKAANRSHEAGDRVNPLIIAEIDDCSIVEQQLRWEHFFALSELPSFAGYFSGNKSVHVYFHVPGVESIELWRHLQGQLTAILGSDSALNKPSQPIRLPGIPRYIPSRNRWSRVEEIWLDAAAVITPEEFQAGLSKAWPYEYEYSTERFGLYTSWSGAAGISAKAKELGVTKAVDAFNLSEEQLGTLLRNNRGKGSANGSANGKAEPKNGSTSAQPWDGKTSENPWGAFLQDQLLPALTSRSLEWQYALGGFAHDFQDQSGNDGIEGLSPWSQTNSSGTSFKVAGDGRWYCFASHQGGHINQYLQLSWYNSTSLRGKDFIEYVKRLAGELSIEVPTFAKASPLSKLVATAPIVAATEGINNDATVAAAAAAADADSVAPSAGASRRLQMRSGDRTVNSERLSDSLPASDLFSAEHPVIALASPTGSGKTHVVNAAIDNLLKADPTATVICFTHRRGNGRGAAARLQRDTGAGVFLNDVGAIDLATGRGIGGIRDSQLAEERVLTLCPDSIHKLDRLILDLSLAGKRIYIFGDEWQALMGHVLQGSTISHKRAAVLERIKTLCEAAVRTGGAIVVADAYLDNLGREFLEQAAGCESHLIVNAAPGVTHPIAWHTVTKRDKKGNLKLVTDAELRNEVHKTVIHLLASGKRVVVPTDSQAIAEQLQLAVKEQFPDKVSFRFDRKTTNDADVREFIEDPNTYLTENHPDLFIFSPSMGEGVSIDVNAFDAQVLAASHLNPDRQLQAIKRVRTPLMTHVFCNQRAWGAATPTSVESILTSDAARFSAILSTTGAINRAGVAARRAIESPTAWIEYCKLALAKLEHDKAVHGSDLGTSLRATFIADNWSITDIAYEQILDYGDSGEILLPMADAKSAIESGEATILAEADPLFCTPEVASAKLQSGGCTHKMALGYKKVIDHARFPALGQVRFGATPSADNPIGSIQMLIDESKPLLLNDQNFQLEHMVKSSGKRNLKATQWLYWALNRDAAAQSDIERLGAVFSGSGIWSKDIKGASLVGKLWDALGVDQILGETIHRDHPAVARFHSVALAHKDIIKASWGILFSERISNNTSPIRQTMSLLRQWGIVPVSTSRPLSLAKASKGRPVAYTMPSLQELCDGDRGALLASMEHRWRVSGGQNSNRSNSDSFSSQNNETYVGQAVRYGGMDLRIVAFGDGNAYCVPLEAKTYGNTDLLTVRTLDLEIIEAKTEVDRQRIAA